MSFAMHTNCSTQCPNEWVRGKVIGSGSYGTVRLAMSKSTGEPFVIKSAQKQSGAGLESLDNEANILQTLDSPYIVNCLGRSNSVGPDGEPKADIMLEYMAGGSLADVAARYGGVLDESMIRLYTKEILHGLNYLHENGIVHCDLKCKNVLLGSSGNVKLADLGCSKRVRNGVASGRSGPAIGGTPLWMAPEVVRNEGLDFASDIWSLGCAVIEMATGRLPWAGEVSNPAAALLKIACSNDTPSFPAHFSMDGLDFLAKCLERDPKKRWTSSELLVHPFVSRKLFAFSPASVFDIAIYEDIEEGYNSDDSELDRCGNGESRFPVRNPFSSRVCSPAKRREGRFLDDVGFGDSVTSDSWITVRSG